MQTRSQKQYSIAPKVNSHVMVTRSKSRAPAEKSSILTRAKSSAQILEKKEKEAVEALLLLNRIATDEAEAAEILKSIKF